MSIYIAPKFRSEYTRLQSEVVACNAAMNFLVDSSEYASLGNLLKARNELLAQIKHIEAESQKRSWLDNIVTLVAKTIVEASVVRK